MPRGPGELLGRKQSGQTGLGCLRAARLPGDTPLLEAARSSAKAQLAALGEHRLTSFANILC